MRIETRLPCLASARGTCERMSRRGKAAGVRQSATISKLQAEQLANRSEIGIVDSKVLG